MREPRLRSSPSFFHPSTNRRMYRFASNGEMGEPCGMLLRLLPAGAVAGWALHPLESAAFSRRTPTADVSRCSKNHYSITSSARSKMEVGISIPSVFAVFRLTIDLNLAACSMGISPGFVPLRIFVHEESGAAKKIGKLHSVTEQPAACRQFE